MPRQAPPASSAAFGLRLLAELDGGNIVLSPLGLQLALATLRAGATGATRAALDEVLGPDDPVVEELPAEIAQALWLDAGLRPGPELAHAAEALGIELGSTRFGDPAAVATVNRWAAERTHGMVREVLERFEPGELLVLAGAAYFKDAWTDPFDPAETALATFTRGDGHAVEVAMMSASGRFEYAEEADWRAVRLPYGEEGRLALVVVLGTDGVPRLDSAAWRERMHRRAGRVRLPRLAIETRLDLRKALEAIGLGPAFELGPDLAGLFDGPPQDTALSRVLQNARLEVDEAGTRAAAATVVTAMRVMAPAQPPFEFVADRPFLWAIEDAASATLLFLGVVNDPD
jgi:serine protease inhibitor